MQRQAVEDRRRSARLKQLHNEFIVGIAIMILILTMGALFMWVAYDRSRKYPQYGSDLFPKNEERRRSEAEPKIYIGR
jgi:hypothetical protein